MGMAIPATHQRDVQAVLVKVISGGQIDADQAALRAARACGGAGTERHQSTNERTTTMASDVYQDYLGRPLKLGRDGKAVPYVEPPVKVPKPPRAAKAAKKKPPAASQEAAVPAAIDGDPESVTG
jgi:hypothetical protein